VKRFVRGTPYFVRLDAQVRAKNTAGSSSLDESLQLTCPRITHCSFQNFVLRNLRLKTILDDGPASRYTRSHQPEQETPSGLFEEVKSMTRRLAHNRRRIEHKGMRSDTLENLSQLECVVKFRIHATVLVNYGLSGSSEIAELRFDPALTGLCEQAGNRNSQRSALCLGYRSL
jgi:hypothetical protein